MKTLILTSIYSNLWGTEFGGRPGRGFHYRHSLLNILNIKPTKVVCVTSKEEINDLKDFFYVRNGVSSSLLEFIEFDLKNTKYFDKIIKIKDVENAKKSDRCYEIQYNKFFWFELIKDCQNYDRIYWFDAGLSHGGLFPDQYRKSNKSDGYYQINLFTPQYLNYLNLLTQEKILLISKNNLGQFFWSQHLPTQYYNQFDRSEHIIGGFFGGTPQKFIKLCESFDNLLTFLLNKENSLYMEELLMTCLYFNQKDDYITLKFDDWYKRPNHTDNSIKYFYNMFEI